MANIKSQKKRNLTNAKRHERNKAVRAELKTRIKTAEAAPDDAEAVRAAVKRIDMAATKGVIHKNTAARMKSRMMRHVASSTAS
jgi:small subunit ribosomal protein S20